MPKLSKARLRGLYPETGPVERHDKQVLVTVSLDHDLYQWLADFVGKNSFTDCVEEALHTALRCMRGNEGGMNLDALAGFVASERGTSRIEAVFGEIDDPAVREASALLYHAALVARCRRYSGHYLEHVLPEKEEDERRVLAALRTVLPDWDPKKDLEEDHAEQERWMEEHADELAAQAEEAMKKLEERQAKPQTRKDDLDDEIPF